MREIVERNNHGEPANSGCERKSLSEPSGLAMCQADWRGAP